MGIEGDPGWTACVWQSQELVVSFTEWRPGSTAQILSDLDLTSQRDGRWKRINTLMHYNVSAGCRWGGPHMVGLGLP